MSSNPFASPAAIDRDAPPADPIDAATLFKRDRFLLKQKMLAIINETYRVFDEHEQVLLHVRRPGRILKNMLAVVVMAIGILVGITIGAMIGSALHEAVGILVGAILVVGAVIAGVLISPRRGLRFCLDKELARMVLDVTQDNRLAVPVAWFTLRDDQGRVLCRFRKNFLWNLFRRRWSIHAEDGTILWMVKEDSIIKSVIRRIAPDFIAAFMRTNFVFLAENGTVIGTFNRKLAIRDHYALDLTADPEHRLDRRIAVAMAVLLDTGERR